jgi:hypothetical protein
MRGSNYRSTFQNLYSYICYINLQSLRYWEEGSFRQKDQSTHLWEKEFFFQYCTLYGKTRSFLMLEQVFPIVTTGFCIQHSRQPLGLISETDTVYYVILFRRNLIMTLSAALLRCRMHAVQIETKDEILESMCKPFMNHERGSV